MVSYKFVLPGEAHKVSCHLTWIPESLSYLEVCMQERASNLKDYLQCLILHRPAKDIEATAENGAVSEMEVHSFGEEAHTIFGLLAKQLNQIAFYTYIGDFPTAKNVLNITKAKVIAFSDDERKEMMGGYSTAIKYCIDAAEFQIKYLEHFKLSQAGGMRSYRDVARIASEMQDIIRTWILQSGNNQFLATIQFLKGRLASALQVKRDVALQNFLNAAQLDGNFDAWNHYAYWELRRNRGAETFGPFSRPGTEERNFCLRAHELSPNKPMIMLDYALLQKDDLWYGTYSRDKQQLNECVNAFENVLKAASKSRIPYENQRVPEITVYLAEFLLFGYDDSLDRERGKMLLEKYGENSKALHKLAKMHHRGIYIKGILTYFDEEKAEVLYKKSLKLDPSDYPCLKNYLILLKSKKKYYEMISLIDSYLKTCRRDYLAVELLVTRGRTIWIDNGNKAPIYSRREACLSWILALAKYPEFAGKVYDAVNDFIVREEESRKPNKMLLVNELQKLLDYGWNDWFKKAGYEQNQIKPLVELLIANVAKNPSYCYPSAAMGNYYLLRESAERSFISDADVDINWRERFVTKP